MEPRSLFNRIRFLEALMETVDKHGSKTVSNLLAEITIRWGAVLNYAALSGYLGELKENGFIDDNRNITEKGRLLMTSLKEINNLLEV
jgi:predicted transcriptional regulator